MTTENWPGAKNILTKSGKGYCSGLLFFVLEGPIPTCTPVWESNALIALERELGGWIQTRVCTIGVLTRVTCSVAPTYLGPPLGASSLSRVAFPCVEPLTRQ